MTQRLAALLILSASLMAGCAMSSTPAASERIDHVVFAISDLDRGTAQLGAICGVMPVPGGKHPHTGTQNALLSAGSLAYLEVLAPQEGVQLAPEYQPLRSLADLTPADWAVATRNSWRRSSSNGMRLPHIPRRRHRKGAHYSRSRCALRTMKRSVVCSTC